MGIKFLPWLGFPGSLAPAFPFSLHVLPAVFSFKRHCVLLVMWDTEVHSSPHITTLFRPSYAARGLLSAKII